MSDPIQAVLDALREIETTNDPRAVEAAYRLGLVGTDRLHALRRKAARQLVEAIRRAIACPNGPR